MTRRPGVAARAARAVRGLWPDRNPLRQPQRPSLPLLPDPESSHSTTVLEPISISESSPNPASATEPDSA